MTSISNLKLAKRRASKQLFLLAFYNGRFDASILRQAQQPQAQRPQTLLTISMAEPVEATTFVSHL